MMTPNRKSLAALPYAILIVLIFIIATPKITSAGESLVLAVHPYLSHEELMKKFMPLANYLGNKIGKKINVKIGSTYEEHIQYIGQNKVDIAYMGPASYVTMVNAYGEKPVLARLEINGHPWFQGNIITRQDSDVATIDELKGKKIAFGDPNSTMSYLVPHYMLHKAGVFIDKESDHSFLNSHNNVALGVLSGDFDAGAVKPAVFRKYQAKGLRTIAKTEKISEHLFVTRSNLQSSLRKKLRHVMIDMKNSEEGLNALHAIKTSITGVVEANSGNYENLRKIILESKELH